MNILVNKKLKADSHFSNDKLTHASFYPLVKDRKFRLMFSKNNKDFVSFFLASLFSLDYDYVYNNIRINNNVLTSDIVNEVSKTVDFICEIDKKLYIIEINSQAKLSSLRRKKLKRYNCVYLININNFYLSTAQDTLDKEQTLMRRKDKLVSYGKDYEVYDIYLPLLYKLCYTYSKRKENKKVRKMGRIFINNIIR